MLASSGLADLSPGLISAFCYRLVVCITEYELEYPGNENEMNNYMDGVERNMRMHRFSWRHEKKEEENMRWNK